MQEGKFNIILDQAWGSSGKGKISTWLADNYNITKVSSSNFPNAGHTVELNGIRFIAKAIPTCAILKKAKGIGMSCWLSPGSGFRWDRLIQEWLECGKPEINIHARANIITDEHKEKEQSGRDSTKHIASTMQGTAIALCDKILRRADCLLTSNSEHELRKALIEKNITHGEFFAKIRIVEASEFRALVQQQILAGQTWFHEGSQGYALSIDHGSHYPQCTSRNCTLQKAMDDMAIPPKMVGDVYLNLRTFPIRVGNVVEEGEQKGYSGDFYSDCEELSWENIAERSGMPDEEKKALAERERTTVTKRIRRVATFSFNALKDAVITNGATKIAVNFIQYLNWEDNGLSGEKDAFEKLSKESRTFIKKIEDTANLPVVLVGTGPKHTEIISLL